MKLVLEGRCWKLFDNVPNDGGLIDKKYMADQLNYNSKKLGQICLAPILPEFTEKAMPGDIIVAGKRFAHGNPHIQAFLGLKSRGVGIVVESIPRSSFRIVISAGLPILPSCPGVLEEVEDGDRIQVDFENGVIRNMTRNTEKTYTPLPAFLLEVIKKGGSEFVPYFMVNNGK